MRGTAYVFGDEINTDIITPRGSDYIGADLTDILMDPVRPNFASEVDDGDLIVAGDHFGSGSSRETAPRAIQEAGISAVIAESFARIYYRNSVNIGLPAIPCPGVTRVVSEGDEMEVDLESGVIRNHSTGDAVEFEAPGDVIQSIYDAGGLFQFYHARE